MHTLDRRRTTAAAWSWPSASGGLCPFLDDPQVFLCNTGAEAVEGAIKLARRVTARPGIIGFRGGFHGRTIGATSLTTAKGKYRAGYEPLLGGITIAPYAYPLRHGGGEEATAVRTGRPRRAARAAGSGLDHRGDDRRAGARRGRLRARAGGVAARACASGATSTASCWCSTRCSAASGGTGRMFAAERFGVAPDVVLFAKGIASGLPLGGLIAGRGPVRAVADGHPRLDLRRQPGRRARPRWPRST